MKLNQLSRLLAGIACNFITLNSLIAISADPPEILNQPTDTAVFNGQQLVVEIPVNSLNPTFQWYRNDTLLPGEMTNQLELDSVIFEHEASYQLQVSNATDTVWSDPFEIFVFPTQDSVFPVNFAVCTEDPVYISTYLTGYDYLWSTGDTGREIFIHDPGEYSVFVSKNAGTGVTYSFQVDQNPTVSEYSGRYHGTYVLCADTVFIVGDCHIYNARISPGTKIIFTGDYTLEFFSFSGQGTVLDSIYFYGHAPNESGEAMGSVVYVGPGSQLTPEVRLSNVCMRHLKEVNLPGVSGGVVSDCKHVQISYAVDLNLHHNNSVTLSHNANNCHVYANGNIYARAGGMAPGNAVSLEIDHCTFSNNQSGLQLSGSAYTASIRNTIFRNNAGTALNLDGLYGFGSGCDVEIWNNSFINNSSPDGSGAISSPMRGSIRQLNNNLFAGNTSASGFSTVEMHSTDAPTLAFNREILHNTFFNNVSMESTGVEISGGGEDVNNYLLNNIFWNGSSNFDQTAVAIAASSLGQCIVGSSVFNSGIEAVDNQSSVAVDFSNILSMYPEFADTLNGNYRLVELSSCINQGTPLNGLSTISADLDGNPRIFALRSDIGAYEFSSLQTPVVLSQPQDTSFYMGEEVQIEIGLNGIYEYFWYRNDVLLDGQRSNILGIDSFAAVDTGTYQLMIHNLTDSVWSSKFRIDQMPPIEIEWADTNYLCQDDSVLLATHLAGYKFLWSTGDTTSSIVVSQPGVYEVFISLDGIRGEYHHTVVDYYPTILEVSGDYTGVTYWCSDTVKIIGDCTFDELHITPGLVVQYQDDYEIRANWLVAFGTETDSILFTGKLNKTDTVKKGRMYNRAYFKLMTARFKYAKFNQLNDIVLCNLRNSKVQNCDSIYSSITSSTTFETNNFLGFIYSVDSCRVIDNSELGYLLTSKLHPGEIEFTCANSYFSNNRTGLVQANRSLGYLAYASFSGCTFIENNGPAIDFSKTIEDNPWFSFGVKGCSFIRNRGGVKCTGYPSTRFYAYRNEFINNRDIPIACNVSGYSIYNNLFYRNAVNDGPGAIQCNHDYEFGSIHSNTFYGNHGDSASCIDLTSRYTGMNTISSNIFWNNTSNLSNYVFDLDLWDGYAIAPVIDISHCVFQDTSKIALLIGDDSVTNVTHMYTAYPEFVDTLNNNFRLQVQSPYINMGDTTLTGVTDLDGNPRIYGRGIDIGCYEYFSELYPVIVSQTGDTAVCNFDTITLAVVTGDMYNYQWYRNDTVIAAARDSELILSDNYERGNEYAVRIHNLQDTIWSTPMVISAASAPSIVSEPHSVKMCENGDTLLTVDYVSELPGTVEWYSEVGGRLGSTGDHLYMQNIVENDQITAVVRNACGSDSSGVAQLVVHALPIVELGADTALYAGDSILLNYHHFDTYLWSTGATEPSIFGKGGEVIWLQATNAYNCSGRDTIVLNLLSTETSITHTSAEYAIELFPNPACERLTIRIPANVNIPMRVSMHSNDGRLVGETKIYEIGIHTIDLPSGLSSGFYSLVFKSDGHIYTKRFMIQ